MQLLAERFTHLTTSLRDVFGSPRQPEQEGVTPGRHTRRPGAHRRHRGQNRTALMGGTAIAWEPAIQ